MIAYLRLVSRCLLLILLSAVTASFVLSNTQAIELRLFPLPYVASVPLFALAALLLTGGFLLGIIVTSLGMTARQFRLRRSLKTERQQRAALETELQTTRTLQRAVPAPIPVRSPDSAG